MRKSLQEQERVAIIEARSTMPASKIPAALGIPSSTVNTVLSAAGLTKARADVLERDQRRVAEWLQNGSEATDHEQEQEQEQDPYAGVPVRVLKETAAAQGITGYSRMRRDDLIIALADAAHAAE